MLGPRTGVKSFRAGVAVGVGADPLAPDGGAPTLVSIAVTPATPTIAYGGTQQMTATGTYSDTSTADLTGSVAWSSGTPATGTISAGGLVTAVEAGTTVVTATLGAISGNTTATVDVPRDNGWPMPTNAAQFAALGVTMVDFLHECQEASGDLASLIGTLQLVKNGTPAFQQAFGAFTRKCVEIAEVSGQRFAAPAGQGPNIAAESGMIIILGIISAAPASTGRVAFGLNITGSGSMMMQTTTTPRVRGNVNGVTATGTSDPTAAGAQLYGLMLNRNAGTAGLYTGQEKVALTYAAAVTDANKGLGGSGSVAQPMKIARVYWWKGANAELTDAQMKTRMTALGQAGIPWS